jgi:RNA polymerase sigma-70 factor (ECF subfamily)
MEHNGTLRKALDGDINAFQELFKGFQSQLKSYLYRLMANRNDAEDLTHDTFIKAFDKLSTYKSEASLKTWVFQIATHLAYNELRKRKRWTPDVSEKAKKLVLESEELQGMLTEINSTSPNGAYDIREHVDTCFTCIAKNLPIENQVAVLLKDVYGFSVEEIAQILDKTLGVAKYLLQDGRKVMTDVFEERCALVSKQGVCHQCSELNGWFNPRQNQQEALMRLDLVKGSAKYDRERLYEMRALLVSNIDPLQSTGHVLQEALLSCNSKAMGEQ